MQRNHRLSDEISFLDQELPAGTLRLLQISDSHLYEDPQQQLLGLNTLNSLRRVIAEYQQQYEKPDLVLATGDLVHDAGQPAYEQLNRELSSLDAPVYCLPGNHDNTSLMQKYLVTAQVSAPKVVDLGNWRFILLDSVIPGQEAGFLSPAELQLLGEQLDTDRYVMIGLHHQPVAVGSRWIDRIGLQNSAAFFDVVNSSRQVRGIVWGHVHQAFESSHQLVRLMSAPSTCIQFAPNVANFQLDDKAPGARLLALLPNGEVRTSVMRLPELPAEINLASAGY